MGTGESSRNTTCSNIGFHHTKSSTLRSPRETRRLGRVLTNRSHSLSPQLYQCSPKPTLGVTLKDNSCHRCPQVRLTSNLAYSEAGPAWCQRDSHRKPSLHRNTQTFDRGRDSLVTRLAGTSSSLPTSRMSQEPSWPPLSPHAALLSSPSGRKNHQLSTNTSSPMKRSATTPSLLERLRAARRNNEYAVNGERKADEEVEEDEETLQLQLAAIEAKLKLKRLQQIKAKAELEPQSSTKRLTPPGSPERTTVRPGASLGQRQERAISRGAQVEVCLSPVKRPDLPGQLKSPGRVVLGIDKGVRGADVSLRRAHTGAGSGHRVPLEASTETRSVKTLGSRSAHLRSSTEGSRGSDARSFSERMAESREAQKAKDVKREDGGRNRSRRFEIDQVEMKGYRLAAEKSHLNEQPTRSGPRKEYSREEVLLATRHAKSGGRVLKKSRTMPDLGQSPSRPSSRAQASPSRSDEADDPDHGDAALFEGFSRFHLSSRILPHSFLKRTLPSDRFTIYRIADLLREVVSPEYELPDSVGDYVVFGIIASKSSPLDHKQTHGDDKTVGSHDWERRWEDGSQNQSKFMVFTLTDLEWSLNLYIFGTALPRYHRLSPGTVVAILNPSIMPPKKGKEDTGAFSLTLHSGDDTVLEIGIARDIGYCNAVRKDGKECGTWVNASKTEICEWHLNLQLYKTQAGRMGVNTGSNGFGAGLGKGSNNRNNVFDRRRVGIREGEGRGGLLPHKEGQQYDKWTGSHFYVSNSNPGVRARNSGGPAHPGAVSAARMLDMDENGPFVPEGQLSRDREARWQKRMAAQEKEREIARRLTAIGSGGAGEEYLRHKTANTPSHGVEKAVGEAGSQRSAVSTRASILKPQSNINLNGKRPADNVRLSPVKKTRFVTEKGIREAGRDSVGASGVQLDGDDDLEIV